MLIVECQWAYLILASQHEVTPYSQHPAVLHFIGQASLCLALSTLEDHLARNTPFPTPGSQEQAIPATILQSLLLGL